MEQHGAHAATPGSFAAWSSRVGELCAAVEEIAPLAAALGAPDPRAADWHGSLFGKLRPQASREPVLVAAVCGGTNTGKSLVANTLAGTPISRSLPEAARTLHPVASLPRGLAPRIDLAALFPGFVPVAWSGEDDALLAAPEHRLVWREDATGAQPDRLVLLDTPDIDGTLRENWRRAELVRDAADVIVAVLTQQKYNDAAVRDFFAAAAAADKTVFVVVNMVDWPGQRERIAGWLATFTAETGVVPAAVYAAPHDFAAAEAGRLTLHALPELAADGGALGLAERLAAADFDRIKRRAMAGAMRVVADPAHGLASWLDAVDGAAAGWRDAQRLLEREGRIDFKLPAAPREIVWDEFWAWLEPRRMSLDLAISSVYRRIGGTLARAARFVGFGRSAAERQDDFTGAELEALKRVLADFTDRLADVCRRDERLAAILGPRLAAGDRNAWFAELGRRHAALPMVSAGYRAFVRGRLDRFAAENPGMLATLVAGLAVGSVARPVLTIGLFGLGGALVPAAAGVFHHVIDVGVNVGLPVAGEVAVVGASHGVGAFVAGLFDEWSRERGQVLTETIHDVVLGDGLEEIARRAAAGARPELARARSLLAACAVECR
mgnify:CR=1 FL=1